MGRQMPAKGSTGLSQVALEMKEAGTFWLVPPPPRPGDTGSIVYELLGCLQERRHPTVGSPEKKIPCPSLGWAPNPHHAAQIGTELSLIYLT